MPWSSMMSAMLGGISPITQYEEDKIEFIKVKLNSARFSHVFNINF